MGRFEPVTNELHLAGVKTEFDDVVQPISTQEAVEDRVRLGIRDTQVALVRLTVDQVGARGLVHYGVGHPHVASQLPDLALEQIADGIDGRRVIRVPGKIAEQPLGLVAGAKREGGQRRGQIEQRYHPHPRHDVAPPSRGGIIADGRVEAVDPAGDVHRSDFDSQLVGHHLGVLQALVARGPVRHADADDMLRAKSLGGQEGDQ